MDNSNSICSICNTGLQLTKRRSNARFHDTNSVQDIWTTTGWPKKGAFSSLQFLYSITMEGVPYIQLSSSLCFAHHHI